MDSHAQGVLANGSNHTGRISVSREVDEWTFTANKDDSITVSIAEVFEGEVDPGFYPRIRLRRPDGAQAATSGGYVAGELTVTAPLTGTYTVLVDDNSGSDRTGSYMLRLAQTPGTFVVPEGDEGGPLTNGAIHPGKITLGDLDQWTFEAAQGDNISVSIAEVFEGELDPGFYPRIRLRRPDGAQAATSGGYVAGELTVTAPLTGTYTVLVDDNSGSDRAGSYVLRLAQTPGTFVVPEGDEGGPLTNGANHPGKITLGDLDQWTFEAAQGDSITVSIGEVFEGELDPGFYPRIRLLRPDGAQAGTSGGYLAAQVTVTAPLSGIYTVLVDDNSGSDRTGSYLLRLAQTPGTFVVPEGDEGGPLTNGANHPGRIALGDVDLWTFEAAQGDSITVSIGEVFEGEVDPGFYPRIRLRRPDGVQAATSGGYLAAQVTVTAPLSGIYTVVVDDNSGSDRTGSYLLRLAQTPGSFVVSEGDEGGPLANGRNQPGKITLGDVDLWTFEAMQGDSITVKIIEVFEGEVDPGFYPRIRLRRPDGVQAATRGDYLEAQVTLKAPLSGTYTIVVDDNSGSDRTGSYLIRLSRLAPDLVVPDLPFVDELIPLQVSIWAVDPETPEKELTFELLSAPPGATLTAASATNATIVWATTELLGPGTNVFIARVTDVVGGTPYRRTNSFTVVVNEVNSAPQLTIPDPQEITELTPLSVSVSGSDSDLPANPLSFHLVSPPDGMGIDAASGAISWTPTEAQAPSTNTITVVVTDSNPAAVNATQLSTTNTFVVVVREVNLPPQLPQPANSTVDELTPFSVALQAADPDLPPNVLLFSLLEAPEGVTIDAATGVIRWTPTETQGPGTHWIAFKVEDGGQPSLSATNRLSLEVREVNAAPVIAVIPAQEAPAETEFRMTVAATDPDQPANVLTYALGAGAPAGATLHPSTGELVWPTGIRLARETVSIPVRVTDNGTPPLSAEASVQVTVIPTILRLARIEDRAMDEGGLLTLTAEVINSPQASPPFAFALEGAVPEGASINPTTGVLFWRPGESQGPTNQVLTVRVTDTATSPNTYAQSFTVNVREVNQAPVLSAIPSQTTIPGGVLNVTVSGADEDVPTNQLTYALDGGAPSDMTINAATGVIRWTPGATYAGTTNRITVRVTDDGIPSLSATQVLQVTVGASTETRLAAERLSDGQLRLVLTGDIGRTYLVETSGNLRTWTMLTNFVSSTATTEIGVSTGTESPQRFYRAISP